MAAGLRFKAAYHEFFADNGDTHYGREWSLGAFKSFPTDAGDFVLSVRAADYDADAFGSDTTKVWAYVDFRLAPITFSDIAAFLSDE